MDAGEEFGSRESAVAIGVSRGQPSRSVVSYRANAKIMRLLVVMTLNVAKIRHTSGSLDSKVR